MLPDIAKKTVFVYMAADNNLHRNAKTDVQEMLDSEIPDGCNLVVYVDAPLWLDEKIPQLFKAQSGELIPVKQYESHNSASKEVLSQVAGDVIDKFRAEAYDLVLWSHGTGWLPKNALSTLTKSFGREGGSEIEITDLAAALPVKFGCIIFDACWMGSIEVCYQLRSKADVIIASPTEVIAAAGFPYNEIISLLFAASPNYVEIARKYMTYYKNQTGAYQSAAISVVDTKQLKALADLLSDVVAAGNVVSVYDHDKIQKYDLLDSSIFYDFMDYIRSVVSSESHIAAIAQQLSKIVVYNDFTPYFLSKLEISSSCGVSTYISHGNSQLDEAYRHLDWFIDTGGFGLQSG